MSMEITNAKYTQEIQGVNSSIVATIDGIICHVPMDLGNKHYVEILRQVDAGILTIAEADE